MGKGFRQADVRRLEELFNHDMPVPFSAEGSITDSYQRLHMRVYDPVKPSDPVCAVHFDYDLGQKFGTQPPAKEAQHYANAFVALCASYETNRAARDLAAARVKAAQRRRRRARALAIGQQPQQADLEP